MNQVLELLAPAGDWDAFLAAVENGADAVYMGGRLFNARQSAANFDTEQLKKALDYAHIRGVKIYLTMNTLISDSEMKEAVDLAEEAYTLGIDGIIVQDLGLASVLKKLYPALELHASTQMTVYNLEGVKELEKLGFKRVVLARELSLDEIAYIGKNTSLEIEGFIHGALCISYSGQCLMSSIIGGRSGNRGKCAQPCRLPYSLVGDNLNQSPSRPLAQPYLLSPKDICTVEWLDKLIDAGVKSFKIEGRMKNAEYVATVVRVYRKYLDRMRKEAPGHKINPVDKQDLRDLAQSFNRGGFSHGYLQKKCGKDMMCFEKPKNWGLPVGDVLSYDAESRTVTIKLSETLSIGDGIEVWNEAEESPGTVVSEIKVKGKRVTTAQAGEIAVVGNIKGNIGKRNKVYKTSDKLLNAAARQSFAGGDGKKISLRAKVTVLRDAPIRVNIEDENGHHAEVLGEVFPEKAIHKPLTEDRIREQLGKTGGTPFTLVQTEIFLEPDLSVPVSELNNLRRKALEEMEVLRLERYLRKLPEEIGESKEKLLHFPGNDRTEKKPARIALYFFSVPQEIDFAEVQADRVYFPFRYFLQEENRKIIHRCKAQGMEVYTALPPITRGNYDLFVKEKLETIIQAGIDGVLLGNIGALDFVQPYGKIKRMGDFSLNIFNRYTAEQMFEFGLQGVTLSPELNMSQISSLRTNQSLEKEAVVYGRLPVMTSEYCPVGSVAGNFSAKEPCNQVCRQGAYALKDRKGMEFPVLCDRIDCRSTILNSNILFVPDILQKIASTGVDILRLNIYDEAPEEIYPLVDLHREILRNGAKAMEQHDALMQRVKGRGFTKGHYFRGV